MSVYEDYIRRSADEAYEACGELESRMVARLEEGDPIAEAVAAVAVARAVAWVWRDVVRAVEQEGLPGAEALVRTREAARRTLTDYPLPRHRCLIEQGFALAKVEAARVFYRTTAHLEQITAPITASAVTPITARTTAGRMS